MLITLHPASDPLFEFLPQSFQGGGSGRQVPVADAWLLPRDDLFVRVADLIAGRDFGLAGTERLVDIFEQDLPIAAFGLSPAMVITVNRRLVKSSLFQCFLAALRRRPSTVVGTILAEPVVPTTIDTDAELTLWSAGPDNHSAAIAKLWGEIVADGTLDEYEALTTPRLYGNKLRLTDLLFGVAVASLPAGTPMLDIMAGTGIVSRKLATRHPVVANDANPYAVVLTRP